MNRHDAELFDERVADWLEDDPELAPRAALDVVLAAFPSIKQRRRGVPWRLADRPSIARFAAAGTALVVVTLGAVALFGSLVWTGPGTSPAPTPTPSPTVSPSPTPAPSVSLTDTSTWVDYTSDRYGFRIARPADWTEQPARRDWTLAEAADLQFDGHEHFEGPLGDVGMSAWAYDPGPDVSLATVDEIVAWVEGYCPQSDSTPCTGIADRAVPLCHEPRDCHPAVLVGFQNDVYAFIPGAADDGRMLIVAVWRPEFDPSVAPYGGAKALLLAFLSTINGGGGAGVSLDPSA